MSSAFKTEKAFRSSSAAWMAERKEAFAAKRRAEAAVERHKRDVLAARLLLADAKIELANIEAQIEAIQKQKPQRRTST